MDFTNWNTEREKLKVEIFKELREQKDRKRFSVVSGSTVIDPRYLTEVGQRKVFGPFLFKTQFIKKPNLTFGQVQTNPDLPFVCQPYVHTWSSSLGSVEGFYLGVYALELADPGLTQHIISWGGEGTASLYRAEARTEAWQTGYDEEKADHLNINTET